MDTTTHPTQISPIGRLQSMPKPSLHTPCSRPASNIRTQGNLVPRVVSVPLFQSSSQKKQRLRDYPRYDVAPKTHRTITPTKTNVNELVWRISASFQYIALKMAKVSKLAERKLIPHRSIIGLGALRKIKYFGDIPRQLLCI